MLVAPWDKAAPGARGGLRCAGDELILSKRVLLPLAVLLACAGPASAEDDASLRHNPAAAQPAVDVTPTASMKRRPRSAARGASREQAAVAGGVVRYDKPVMRNGRMVTWRGAWRDRKGSGRAALASRGKPQREERGSLRAAAPAAAAAASAAAVESEAAKPVRVSIAADPAAAPAVAELGKALADAGLTLEAVEPRADADAAIVHADTVRADQGSASGWVALARLYDCETHILTIGPARAIADLAGKRVDIGPAGSAGAATARRLFELLGVSANFTEGAPDDSMRRLARGETDAVVVIAARPALANAPKGASLVAVPYPPALRDVFLPAELTRADLPNLVAGQPIDTVSIPALLVARAPAPESERRKRLETLAEALPEAAARLGAQTTRLQSKWRDVNFAARTGLPRFAPVDKGISN